ncbi:proliferating cell nuclear antigen (pcna) [Candidatus Parvarchaeota archaeon]|nr:proliferating cell nuclear antigen (pcna) [Candidatus Parvarchaeota archaeon]
MFSLLVENAKSWKAAIDPIVNLIDEGQFEISKDGLSLRAMDPSQIAMISFFMPKSAFVQYESETVSKIGLNFANLTKILARTRDGEQLAISQEDNKLLLKFSANRKKRTFKVPLIDLPAGASREPNITHDAKVKIAAREFKEILKDANLVSTHVTLEATDLGFFVDVKGDTAELKVENEKTPEATLEVEAKANARATFPLKYLEDITKACPDDGAVSIHLKSNAPVKIEYEAESAKATYYLAPRIDTD